VVDALNVFRDSSRRYLQEPAVAVSAIAALAAAPSAEKEVPKELIELLTKETDTFYPCIKAFFFNDRVAPQRSSDGAVACRGYEPYMNTDAKAEMLRSTGIAVGVPTLAISLLWGRGQLVSVVYLPITMVGLPALRAQ
jgi:hypothetical protein